LARFQEQTRLLSGQAAADGSEDILYNTFSIVSGLSSALESLEPNFHQDLNGDGVIGPPTTVIQTDGSTSLVA
jgi:hypothetical protein